MKLQKARENARRTEKEKEAERYESLMHDFLVRKYELNFSHFSYCEHHIFIQDQNLAEERRQNELRRKMDRLHESRQLYEALQAKNHELFVAKY